jgi:hypothetical protein
MNIVNDTGRERQEAYLPKKAAGGLRGKFIAYRQITPIKRASLSP